MKYKDALNTYFFGYAKFLLQLHTFLMNKVYKHYFDPQKQGKKISSSLPSYVNMWKYMIRSGYLCLLTLRQINAYGSCNAS